MRAGRVSRRLTKALIAAIKVHGMMGPILLWKVVGMKDRPYIVFVVFLAAALISLSCRLVSGTEIPASSPKDRETVPGSSGRPAKAEGSAGFAGVAATRTLAPPAGSAALEASEFHSDYTPAAPQLLPLSIQSADEATAVPTETLAPTVTLASTHTLAPTQAAAPAAGVTATRPAATATQAAGPTAAGAATATLSPTTAAPTATTGSPAYPAAATTAVPATSYPAPDVALTATPTLSVTATLTPTPTSTPTLTVTPGQ